MFPAFQTSPWSWMTYGTHVSSGSRADEVGIYSGQLIRAATSLWLVCSSANALSPRQELKR